MVKMNKKIIWLIVGMILIVGASVFAEISSRRPEPIGVDCNKLIACGYTCVYHIEEKPIINKDENSYMIINFGNGKYESILINESLGNTFDKQVAKSEEQGLKDLAKTCIPLVVDERIIDTGVVDLT